MPRSISTAAAILALCWAALAQTEQAYEQTPAEKSTSLLDASRFSVHQSISFGMSTAGSSDLKSQSLYSTMIQYRFAKPVTLTLNFGLPIHSTSNDSRNLTWDNIESLEYFKNMPWDISMDWKPRENLLFRLSVANRTYDDYLFGSVGSPWQYNTLTESWMGPTSSSRLKQPAK